MQHYQSSKIDRIIKALLYSQMVSIPILFCPDFYSVFTLPKLTVFRLVTAFIVILWLFKSYISEKFVFKRSWLYLPLVIVALAAIVSTVFSTNLITSLYGQQGRFMGLFTMLNFFLLPVLIINFFDRRDLLKILKLNVIVASLVALYGLSQHFNLFQFFSHSLIWSESATERIFSSIGHGMHLGTYLAMNIVIALGLLFTPEAKLSPLSSSLRASSRQSAFWTTHLPFITKIFLIMSILLQGLVLFLTASRAALLALIAVSIVFVVVVALQHKSFLKKHAFKLLGSLAIVVVLAGLLTAFNWQTLQNTAMVQRTSATFQNWQKGIVPDRISWILSSIEIFKSQPFFGSGLSTFRDEYSQVRRKDYLVAGPGEIQYLIIPEAAHNEFFNLLATQGLLGVFAYLFLFVAVIEKFFQAFKKNQSRLAGMVMLTLVSALGVYLLQSLLGFAVVTTLFMFYLLLGCIGLFLAPEENPPKTATALSVKSSLALAKKSAKPTLNQLSFKFTGIFKYFLSSFLLIVTFIVLFGAMMEAKADLSFKKAKMNEAQRNYLQAEKFYIQAIRNKPWEYSYSQEYADFLLKISFAMDDREEKTNYLNKSIANYQQAFRLNKFYPSTVHNLAIAYLQAYALQPNNVELRQAVLALLELSTKLAPNNALYFYEAARHYKTLGEHSKAQEALQQVLEIKADYRDTKTLLDTFSKKTPIN